MVPQADPTPPGTDPLITMFLDALVAMRAASANTLAAYRRDLADTSQLLRGGNTCLLYTSPSPRDRQKSRMPSSA